MGISMSAALPLRVCLVILVMFGITSIGSTASITELSRSKRQTSNDTQISQIKSDLDPLKVVDLVILVDSSKGMGKDTFYIKEKAILAAIIKHYAVIHPDRVRLAVVRFAVSAEVVLDYISNGNETSLLKCHLFGGNNPMWNALTYIDDGSNEGTNVKTVLEIADAILNRGRELRTSAKQIIILSTDADYDQREYEATKTTAETIIAKGVTIYGIGAGQWLKPGNLEANVSPNLYERLDVWENLLFQTTPYINYGPASTALWEYTDSSWLNKSDNYCSSGCGLNSDCYCDPFSGQELCQCQPGYFLLSLDSQSEDICSPCSPHNYKDEIGNQKCSSCPPPSYTNDTGSTSTDDCICPPDGAGCTDECRPNPCRTNQVCDNINALDFECVCETNWADTDEDPNILECLRHTDNDCLVNDDCQNGATCVDLNEGHACICQRGYYGNTCELQEDLCIYSICENGATCMPRVNDFNCQCTNDWKGRFCQDAKPTTTTTTTTTSTTTTTTTPGPSTTSTPSTSTSTSTSTAESPTTPTLSSSTQIPRTTKAASTDDDDDDDNMLYIIIGAAVGGFLLLLIIIILITCLCLRRKQQREKEIPPKEEEMQRSDGSRLYRKNRTVKQTMSNRFSDFWRKKTMRPGFSFFNESDKGLPSVPPRRRPDLLGHMNDGFSTLQSEAEVEYATMDNQQIVESGGMDGWLKYIKEIQSSGLVEKACILKLTGKKRACSNNWDYESSEVEKLQIIMENQDTHVPCLVQQGEYHIHKNDGEVAVGKTIGSEQDSKLLVIGKTSSFLVVGIANGENDNGLCEKEIQWITDHIKTEGY